MERFIKIADIPSRKMIPGFQARFVHTENMTISHWEIDKGSALPEHSHHHEQVSQVIEGEFEFTIDGEKMVLTPGMMAIIPSNAIHSGIALTDCKVMDIFTPRREDYMVK